MRRRRFVSSITFQSWLEELLIRSRGSTPGRSRAKTPRQRRPPTRRIAWGCGRRRIRAAIVWFQYSSCPSSPLCSCPAAKREPTVKTKTAITTRLSNKRYWVRAPPPPHNRAANSTHTHARTTEITESGRCKAKHCSA